MTLVNLLFSRLKHLLVEEFIFVGFNQLTVQKKMSFGTLFVKCCCQVKIGLYHYFVLFFYFLSSDDHIFLFERSQYMPVLIVHRLIQFSKEENWFYKRFQQTFQKWGKNYFLCIFIGPESDHWLYLSLTDSLTNWLTNSLLFSKLDWCDSGVWRRQLNTCWGFYCSWCW